MPKPETLKDLMQSGDISGMDLDKLACTLFVEDNILGQNVLPYTIFMPKFHNLPLHVQGFVKKAILECKIVNPLDEYEAAHDSLDDDYVDVDEDDE